MFSFLRSHLALAIAITISASLIPVLGTLACTRPRPASDVPRPAEPPPQDPGAPPSDAQRSGPPEHPIQEGPDIPRVNAQLGSGITPGTEIGAEGLFVTDAGIPPPVGPVGPLGTILDGGIMTVDPFGLTDAGSRIGVSTFDAGTLPDAGLFGDAGLAPGAPIAPGVPNIPPPPVVPPPPTFTPGLTPGL